MKDDLQYIEHFTYRHQSARRAEKMHTESERGTYNDIENIEVRKNMIRRGPIDKIINKIEQILFIYFEDMSGQM